MSKKPLKINRLSFKSIILQSKSPVLLEFGAIWDSDSRDLYDNLKWYCKMFENRMLVCYVDYEDMSDFFSEYEIQKLPTLIIFEDGKPFARHIGFNSQSEIDNLLLRFFGYLPYDPKHKPFL